MNILMLSGPLYMLQVYDRVLTSRSLETLALLTILLIGLYLVFGVLDAIRARVLSRISIRLDRLLGGTLLKRAVRPGSAKSDPNAGRLMGDLEQIRQFVAGPAAAAMLDLPWTPLYFFILFLLHPLLGLAAIAGAGILVAVSLANQLLTLQPLARAAEENQRSNAILEGGRRGTEALQAMGMVEAHRWRWLAAHRRALSQQLRAGDIASSASAASKVSRMLLQSLMLALGAYLVIEGSASAGAMIASSILAARALAPIEQLVAQWRGIDGVRAALRRCREALNVKGPPEDRIALPYPQGDLSVRNLYVSAIGETETVLKGLTFRLAPGDAVAVVGPSASGKSTLARALVGGLADPPWRHSPGWRVAGAMARRTARQAGRLSASGRGAVRGYHRREHCPPRSRSRPGVRDHRCGSGRRARHDCAAHGRLQHASWRRRHGAVGAASGNASRSPARSTASRRWSSWTNPTPISTAQARPRSLPRSPGCGMPAASWS